jgi:hypothetical protein
VYITDEVLYVVAASFVTHINFGLNKSFRNGTLCVVNVNTVSFGTVCVVNVNTCLVAVCTVLSSEVSS